MPGVAPGAAPGFSAGHAPSQPSGFGRTYDERVAPSPGFDAGGFARSVACGLDAGRPHALPGQAVAAPAGGGFADIGHAARGLHAGFGDHTGGIRNGLGHGAVGAQWDARADPPAPPAPPWWQSASVPQPAASGPEPGLYTAGLGGSGGRAEELPRSTWAQGIGHYTGSPAPPSPGGSFGGPHGAHLGASSGLAHDGLAGGLGVGGGRFHGAGDLGGAGSCGFGGGLGGSLGGSFGARGGGPGGGSSSFGGHGGLSSGGLGGLGGGGQGGPSGIGAGGGLGFGSSGARAWGGAEDDRVQAERVPVDIAYLHRSAPGASTPVQQRDASGGHSFPPASSAPRSPRAANAASAADSADPPAVIPLGGPAPRPGDADSADPPAVIPLGGPAPQPGGADEAPGADAAGPSPPARGALSLLEGFKVKLRDIENEIVVTQRSLQVNVVAPGQARDRLAQLEAQVERLQCKGIDSVSTAGLDAETGEAARAMRRNLTREVERLQACLDVGFEEIKASEGFSWTYMYRQFACAFPDRLG